MKKHLYALSLSLCLAAGSLATAFGQVTEKNGTPQAPNYDFEVWDNPEPWGWNSSSCFEAGNAPSQYKRNQSIWASNDIRPGSRGVYSVLIKVTQSSWKHYKFPFGATSYEQMGSLSTGTLYYYDDKGNEKSCIYTNTGDNSKRWAFTGRPDSVVFWVKKGINGGRPADFTLYLHNNKKLEDRNPNGTAVGTVIGSAACKITNTDWQRISLPIKYANNDTPAYLLCSFTAGNNFREVVEGDELWVDDMLFIYKPSLRIDADTVIPVPVRKTEAFATLEIPFSLSGTMSPFNLEADNIVYAELSDANGSFANPLTVGEMTTDESGEIAVKIPTDLPISASTTYKLRLRATNYPLLSENTVALDLHYVYRLTVDANPVWAAQINATDTILRETATYTAVCGNVLPGLHLQNWLLNGEAVSDALSYTLTMDQDYTLTAQFDTNYYDVTVSAGTGGAIDIDGTASADGANPYEARLIHNAVLNLNATADFGYHFREWQLDGQTLSTENPLAFTVTDQANLTAVFDTNVYEISFTAVPAEMGTTTNSGAHKHFTVLSSTAEAAEYAEFLYWRKAGETEAVSFEPVLSIGTVSAAAAYEAVFASQTFDVTTVAEPAGCGHTTGDATYEAFPLTAQAQVEATPAEGYHFTYWTYAIDGLNQTERPTENPFVFVENGHVAHHYAFTAHFDLNRYALTADAEHGTVEGLGSFDHNTEVTLNATPDDGYAFAGWFENGDLIADTPTLAFNLTSDRHLTAVFSPVVYTLTFQVRGDKTLGRITQPAEAEGLYAHFTTLRLAAEPTEGNEFRYWLVNGDTVANTATHSLEVDGGKAVEAVFSPLRKRLTVLNPQDDRGTTTGNGLYEHGSAVEATAAAANGYRFAHWRDEAGNTLTDNPLTIDALTEDRTYTAVFEAESFQLCLTNPTPEQGAATIDGETLTDACPAFPYLHTVTLTAAPAPEHRFAGWLNAGTNDTLTDNPLKLTVRADRHLTALFDMAVYAVQGAAYPAEAAVITGSGDYYLNATAVLEATPRFGFEFDGWYDEQGQLLTNATRLEFPVRKAVYYAARFNRLNQTLTVTAEPADAGTVQGGGKTLYGYNTKVEALPAEGKQFNGWFDEDGLLVSTEATYYPTVLKDATLTARFGPKELNIRLTCEPAEAGRISRVGQTEEDGFFYNQVSPLKAEPTETYTFSHWTDENGNTLSETAVWNDFKPTADMTLTAHFLPRAFNPNVKVMPQQAGELTELPQELVYGQTYTASIARTDSHYRFIGWRDAEGGTLSSEPAYTFTFLNRPIVAQFEALPVNVETVCVPQAGGDVTTTGETRYFETLTLTARPARGYRFAGWQAEDGDRLGENPTLARVLDGDLRLTAVFELESYDMAVTAVPAAGGRIEYPAEAEYGRNVTLKATANEGYAFHAYEDAEGRTVSYEPDYTTTVDGPLTLNARFEPRTYTLRAVPADKKLGQAKGSGLFAFGQTVTVKAWASAAGYTFSHWSTEAQGGDTLSTEAEYRYTVPAENRTIYACFKLKSLQLDLTANLPEAGSLQGGGQKTYGETATLTAKANEGYIWQGFSEHGILLTDEMTYTFTMTEDRHIVGVFAPMMWHVSTFDLPEGVKVKGTGDVANGTEAVIEAVLPKTLELTAWVDAEGDTLGYENPLRLTVYGDLRLTPACTPRRLPLTVEMSPANAGTIVTDGFTDNAGTFAYGADIVLEVRPAHGYTFAGWEENDVPIGNDNPYTYRILNESRLKAVFRPEGWTITTGTNLSLGGTTAGDGTYPQGDTVEVTATPAAGFEFTHWLENGEIVSTEAVYRFVSNDNRLLLADFQVHYFQIQVEAQPAISAKVSGSGAYSAHDTVTLSATPANGYAFIGWTYEGETLSNEPTYRFIPERDMLITAQTEKLTASISAVASPAEGGTITGDGEYRVGERVTLTAVPNDGYDFLQWVDENQNVISLDNKSISFTAGDDVRYTAVFGQKVFSEDPHIVIHPIPFGGEVHLEGENMDKIMWFNAFGVKVAQYEINSNTHTIMPTHTWPRGLYVYRIVRNSGKVVKGKALKL